MIIVSPRCKGVLVARASVCEAKVLRGKPRACSAGVMFPLLLLRQTVALASLDFPVLPGTSRCSSSRLKETRVGTGEGPQGYRMKEVPFKVVGLTQTIL
jgi:hypothetical protein